MYRAVIFDVDGTLVDTVDFHAEAWQRVFREFGHSVDYDLIRSQIGKGGDQLMPVVLPADVAERHGEKMDERRTELIKTDYLHRVQGFPLVRDLFLRLREAGIAVALASSAKGAELQTYKKAADIEDLVDEETSSDDAERSKPEPDIFEAALERLGVTASNAVVIGDSPFDAEAASKAGIATIGVLCGGFPERDLRAAGAREIYADPADLLKRFEASLICRGGAA